MSRTFYFGNVTKRKNSTLQGTLTNPFSVLFKNPTSLDYPTLTLNYSGDFDYNAAKYTSTGGKTYYYFVHDKRSRNNDLWEVTLELDTLATYKSRILDSTQFVSYSQNASSEWLQDTRIPLLKNATVSKRSAAMSDIFWASGFYVLSVVGKSGCDLWACDISQIRAILDKITDWSDDLVNDVLAGNYPFQRSSPTQAVVYDFSTIEAALESFANMNMLTGFAGNAYSSAPDCIRSCIWVPFNASLFTNGGGEIWLGQFDSGVHNAFKCKTTAVNGVQSVAIPWQHADWRRATCEEVYLYLPLVGMINVPSDEIINESSITVEWSATATDGCIAYRIIAGDQVIGTYGANCSVNYPLGISQQASAGEIVQTAFQGTQKTVSAALNAVSSVNPLHIAGGAVEASMAAADAMYQTADATMTRHNSCIGGIGGGAGIGLSHDLYCFTVSHDTIVTPSTMAATMGLPTMLPAKLSTLSDGFIQCANAHVPLDADSPIMNIVDTYLNNGFYKE